LKEEKTEFEGTVVGAERTGFNIELDDFSHLVFATLGGKMRKNKIMITVGDRVLVEVSAYDYHRGIITRRLS
jgi:translation initiation factor IF-1